MVARRRVSVAHFWAQTADDDHRADRMCDTVLGDRAEQHPDEAPVAAGAHDEEARFPRGFDEHVRWMSAERLGRHRHPRAFPQDLREHTVEGLLRVLGEST